jgi:hypothetical protein
MGEKRGTYRVSVGKPERKRNLEDPSVDGRIILKGFFRKWEGTCISLIWLRIGTGGRLL